MNNIKFDEEAEQILNNFWQGVGVGIAIAGLLVLT